MVGGCNESVGFDPKAHIVIIYGRIYWLIQLHDDVSPESAQCHHVAPVYSLSGLSAHRFSVITILISWCQVDKLAGCRHVFKYFYGYGR